MKILAISGSLRAASINTAFCRAVTHLAPPQLNVSVYGGLGDLPLFNPDQESCPPISVLDLRRAVDQADALIIASPEYAHGISGVMKNALDWLVSFEGTVYKPIALINTSPRAHHAYESLREVLQTMSTNIVSEASVTLPLLGSCTTEEAMLDSAEISQSIRDALSALANYLMNPYVPAPSFPLR